MGKKRKKKRGGDASSEPASTASADRDDGARPPVVDATPDAAAADAGAEPAPPDEATTILTPTSRRDFLASAGGVMVGACVVGAAAGAARLAVPDAAQGPPPRFALGRPSDFKVNTLTWIRERDLFVIRDGQGFGAFSARCTHLGCTVRRTADGFFCPCHGARFDARGRVLGGPAPAALPWFEVWLEADGRVWVDTAQRAAAGTVALSLPGAAAVDEGVGGGR